LGRCPPYAPTGSTLMGSCLLYVPSLACQLEGWVGGQGLGQRQWHVQEQMMLRYVCHLNTQLVLGWSTPLVGSSFPAATDDQLVQQPLCRLLTPLAAACHLAGVSPGVLPTGRPVPCDPALSCQRRDSDCNRRRHCCRPGWCRLSWCVSQQVFRWLAVQH
jgi:hypothetical protein